MLIPFFAAIGRNSPCKYGLKACKKQTQNKLNKIIKNLKYI